MTAVRLIPLPLHGAFEMLVGMFLVGAPLLLGLGTAPAIIGFVIGMLAIGMALSSTGSDTDGRGTLSVSAHHSVDYGLVTGLFGAAAIVAIAGEQGATYVFAAAGLVQLVLNLTTRYSRR